MKKTTLLLVLSLLTASCATQKRCERKWARVHTDTVWRTITAVSPVELISPQSRVQIELGRLQVDVNDGQHWVLPGVETGLRDTHGRAVVDVWAAEGRLYAAATCMPDTLRDTVRTVLQVPVTVTSVEYINRLRWWQRALICLGAAAGIIALLFVVYSIIRLTA